MSDIQQRVNKTALEKALKSRALNQVALAERIGANSKSFSRWINEGVIQSRYLLDLADELSLSDEEFGEIVMSPRLEVFFRKKFHGNIPEPIREKALDLGRTLLGLTHMNSGEQFCPPDVSRLESPLEVANQIRKYTNIHSFNQLAGVISALADQGVEIAVIPFSKFGLKSEKEYEQAFSVTNGSRCVVFLDAKASESLVLFNLCHELCHLFRPAIEHSTAEEGFCQAVAAELIYPQSYFENNRTTIEYAVSGNSHEAVINLLGSIQNSLGGDIFGIVLQLKNLGFLSQKNAFHKQLLGYGKKIFSSLPTLEENLFSQFDPKNNKSFILFFDALDRQPNILLSFFMRLKRGARDESLSSRKLSELLDVNFGTADELVHRWRRERDREIAEAANG